MKRKLVGALLCLVACGRSQDSSLNHIAIYSEDGTTFAVRYLGDDRFEIFKCHANKGEFLPQFETIEDIDRDCPAGNRELVGASTITEAKEQVHYLIDQYVEMLRDTPDHPSASAARAVQTQGGTRPFEAKQKRAKDLAEELARVQDFARTVGGNGLSNRIRELNERLQELNTQVEQAKPLIDEFKFQVSTMIEKIKDNKVHTLTSRKNAGEISFEFLSYLTAGSYRLFTLGSERIWFRWVPDSRFHGLDPVLEVPVVYEERGFWLQTDEFTNAQAGELMRLNTRDRSLRLNFSAMLGNREDPFLFQRKKMLTDEVRSLVDFALRLGWALSEVGPFSLPRKTQIMAAARCGLPSPKPLSEVLFKDASSAPWIYDSVKSEGRPGKSGSLQPNPCGFRGLLSNVNEVVISGNTWMGGNTYAAVLGDYTSPYRGESVKEAGVQSMDRVGFRLVLDRDIGSPPSSKYQRPVEPGIVDAVQKIQIQPKIPGKRQLYSIYGGNPPLPEERTYGFRRDKKYEGKGMKVLFVYHESPFSDLTEIRAGMILTRFYTEETKQDRGHLSLSASSQMQNTIWRMKKGEMTFVQAYDPFSHRFRTFELPMKSYLEQNKDRIEKAEMEKRKAISSYYQASYPSFQGTPSGFSRGTEGWTEEYHRQQEAIARTRELIARETAERMRRQQEALERYQERIARETAERMRRQQEAIERYQRNYNR